MSNAGRRMERKKDRELARSLTQKGRCSRCEQRAAEHKGGSCPDGLGTFSWTMSEDDLGAVIGKLEAAMETVKQPLTRDEQTVLDYVALAALGSAADGGEREFALASLLLNAPQGRSSSLSDLRFTPEAIAKGTGLELFHVRGLLQSLAQKGYLERHQDPAPS